MDSLPPTHHPAPIAAPVAVAVPVPEALFAPGDIYPVGPRERELCATASHADWAYLAGLLTLDVAAIWGGSAQAITLSSSVPVRMTGPVMIGLAWGATVGGAWLALPKCSAEWVGEPPREGDVRTPWPLAASLALLAGATAPVVNAIASGSTFPMSSSTDERAMHLVAAGLAGAGGALVPYLLPPRTWTAARELQRLRVGTTAGGVFVGFGGTF